MQKQISVSDIKPFVRAIKKININYNDYIKNMWSVDNRLFFVINGNGKLNFKNTSIDLNKNSLAYIPSAEIFSIIGEMQLLSIQFDLTQNFRNINTVEGLKYENKRPNINKINLIYEQLNEIQSFDNLTYITVLLFDIMNSQDESLAKMKAEGLITFLFALAAESIEAVKTASKSEIVADKVIKYIMANYNKNLSNSSLGEIFGYHPNHLNRIIQKSTGKTIHQLILDYKIDLAINMLVNRNMSAVEISKELGFNNVTHFSKCFKNKTGKTTKDFIKRRTI